MLKLELVGGKGPPSVSVRKTARPLKSPLGLSLLRKRGIYCSIGFIVGNSRTSRMEALSVSSMTRRSTPKPRPPGGGQAVLQCVDVVVIHLSLAVGLDGLALGDLTLKAALLVDGVVQLAEGVAVLGAVDEVLKALGESRIVRLALGQRADLEQGNHK